MESFLLSIKPKELKRTGTMIPVGDSVVLFQLQGKVQKSFRVMCSPTNAFCRCLDGFMFTDIAVMVQKILH